MAFGTGWTALSALGLEWTLAQRLMGRAFPRRSKLFEGILNIAALAPRTCTTKIMAKKRKAGGRTYGDSKAPKNDDSKLTINSWEDVADSEDEFLLNREKVMLDEGPAAKRLRKYQEEGMCLT